MIVSFKWLERSLYPLIVFFQLIPKIAIAPLFVVWFGFGPFPKVLLTFLLCFFPTLVASMTGFRALDERVLYLTRSMGANAVADVPLHPPAVGDRRTSSAASRCRSCSPPPARSSPSSSASNSGLGYLLLRATSYLDMPLIFAVLVALSAIGIVFSYAVQLLERLCMPWLRRAIESSHSSMTTTTGGDDDDKTLFVAALVAVAAPRLALAGRGAASQADEADAQLPRRRPAGRVHVREEARLLQGCRHRSDDRGRQGLGDDRATGRDRPDRRRFCRRAGGDADPLQGRAA